MRRSAYTVPGERVGRLVLVNFGQMVSSQIQPTAKHC